MFTFHQLAAATEGALKFIPASGRPLVSRNFVWPSSFRGGFVLIFGAGDSQIVVKYVEMEFSVSAVGREIFGSAHRPTFSGNMFSHEHLIEYLERLAQVVKSELALA